jgi:hypothetical protein
MLLSNSKLGLATGLLFALGQVAQAEPTRAIRAPLNAPVPRGGKSKCSAGPSYPASPSPSPSPTGHPIPSGPGSPCYRPEWNDPNIIIDDLCKCDYYTPEMEYVANVECWTECKPYVDSERKSVPQFKDSLSACINGCYGTFEKKAKRQDDWFCHAINFVEGELCEFLGVVGAIDYDPWGKNCFRIPELGTG